MQIAFNHRCICAITHWVLVAALCVVDVEETHGRAIWSKHQQPTWDNGQHYDKGGPKALMRQKIFTTKAGLISHTRHTVLVKGLGQ